MWHFIFLAFQWHRGRRGFVILSLAFLAFLLYAVANVHLNGTVLVLLRERGLGSHPTRRRKNRVDADPGIPSVGLMPSNPAAHPRAAWA
jgi:hypothetical protein